MACTGLSATNTRSQSTSLHTSWPTNLDGATQGKTQEAFTDSLFQSPISEKTTPQCFFTMAVSWTFCHDASSFARRLVTGLSGDVLSRAAHDSVATSCISICDMLLEPWRMVHQSKHFGRVNYGPEAPPLYIQFSPIAAVLACRLSRCMPPYASKAADAGSSGAWRRHAKDHADISSECCECVCKPILSEVPTNQSSSVAGDSF